MMKLAFLNSRFKTIALSVAVALLFWVLFLFLMPLGGGERRAVIKPGQGLNQIAVRLKKAGLIRSSYLFILYVSALGQADNLKAGSYTMSGWTNIPEVAGALIDGRADSTDIEVTIPEGWNIWEVDEELAKIGLTLRHAFARQFYFKEGRLFPDTYRFPQEGATMAEIANAMEQNYLTKTGVRSDIANITASLLEKEAKSEEDMRLVAGIIEKRMEIGMPLQLDASVIYGACVRKFMQTKRNCDVTQIGVANELKIDSPYNTYTRKGLPAAAISNPGIKALRAAQNPKKSDYLYYLSTRDGSQIIYSKTADEHLRNRQKYLGF